MNLEQVKKSAEKVITLHDGKHYALLQEMSLPSPEDHEEPITEDMYTEMCNDIQQVQGLLSRIEFIDILKRKGSHLTLWKVSYSATEDEVFWGIGFDDETLKVKDVHVNW